MKRTALVVFTLCMVGFLPGCPPATEEDLGISEVSFRYLFEHNASYQQDQADAYYVEIYGKDPPREFLARFEDNTPPVKAASRFRLGGKDGLRFSIEEIERGTSEEVTVHALHDERVCKPWGWDTAWWDYNLSVIHEEDGWVVQPPAVSSWEGADLDICEAVFRYRLDSGLSNDVGCFLRMEGLDPPAEFLARFEGYTPPVLPASAFRLGGFIMDVHVITRLDEEEVRVGGGYSGNMPGAGDYLSQVTLQDGQWVVVQDDHLPVVNKWGEAPG